MLLNTTSHKKNVFWKIVQPFTLKRLNIVDGCPVNDFFFQNMDCIGVFEIDDLKIMFDEEEWKTLMWSLSSLNIPLNTTCFIFQIKIKQHLRLGTRTAYHNEEWIIGLFKTKINTFYLSPLKQLSDLQNDVVASLEKVSRKVPNRPWNRHSIA